MKELQYFNQVNQSKAKVTKVGKEVSIKQMKHRLISQDQRSFHHKFCPLSQHP